MWEYVLTAIALILVMEGILPFLSPQQMRRMLIRIVQQNDRTLRIVGFVTMVSGAILMYLVQSGIFD